MSNQFNVASVLKSVKGVSVSEYTMLSPKVARVIANTVGRMTQSELSDRIGAIFGNRATAVRSSFRWLQENRSAMGFVSLQTPVRAFDQKDVGTKYQAIKANMFMDKADESVWEVKPGSGGSYLARTGEDNLAELIEASRISPRGNVPRMSSIVAASAKPKEMVAFVDLKNGVVDYGFCLSVDASTGDHIVVSTTTNQPTDVMAASVVGVYEVDIPANVHKAVAGNVVLAAGDKSGMIEYYRRAYGYAPDYLAKVIDEINAMSVA